MSYVPANDKSKKLAFPFKHLILTFAREVDASLRQKCYCHLKIDINFDREIIYKLFIPIS